LTAALNEFLQGLSGGAIGRGMRNENGHGLLLACPPPWETDASPHCALTPWLYPAVTGNP
jgi:hypothetical protein